MPIRVAQIGTGNVGAHALRSLIANPDYELTADGHGGSLGSGHRSGMGRSRLGTISPPSTSSIFPVRKLPAGEAR